MLLTTFPSENITLGAGKTLRGALSEVVKGLNPTQKFIVALLSIVFITFTPILFYIGKIYVIIFAGWGVIIVSIIIAVFVYVDIKEGKLTSKSN